MKLIHSFLILLLLSSCKLLQSGQELPTENNDYFHGTVEYRIDVTASKPEHQKTANEIQAMLGNKMLFTVFEDGSILRTYSSNADNGLEMIFLDIEKNELNMSRKGKTEVDVIDATASNLTKTSGLRNTNDNADILGFPLDQYGFLGEETGILTSSLKRQVAHNYYFNSSLKLDKTKYTNISNGMWNTYVAKTGSVFLKKESNYFDYVVTYTATAVKPNVYQTDSRDGMRSKMSPKN